MKIIKKYPSGPVFGGKFVKGEVECRETMKTSCLSFAGRQEVSNTKLTQTPQPTVISALVLGNEI